MDAGQPAPEGIHPWVAEAAERVRFGVVIGAQDPDGVRAFAARAEALGFDSLWASDHPLISGVGCFSALTLAAGTTRAVRLGTCVACVYYWNPVVLARAAADVDRVSGGRLVLGLGSGDHPREFAWLGLRFPPARERARALAEALRIVRPLLAGETVTVEGRQFRAEGAALRGGPVQRPRVPLLIAGGGERTTLRLVAEHGDMSNMGAAGWAGGAYTTADVARKFDVLGGHLRDVGRPPGAVLRSTVIGPVVLSEDAARLAVKVAAIPPVVLATAEGTTLFGTPERAVARLRECVALGFRYVILSTMGSDDETLELLARRVIPAV